MSMSKTERTAAEIGKQLVALSNAHRGLEAVDALYDEKIVSIEAQGNDQMPARMDGIAAVRGFSRRRPRR